MALGFAIKHSVWARMAHHAPHIERARHSQRTLKMGDLYKIGKKQKYKKTNHNMENTKQNTKYAHEQRKQRIRRRRTIWMVTLPV